LVLSRARVLALKVDPSLGLDRCYTAKCPASADCFEGLAGSSSGFGPLPKLREKAVSSALGGRQSVDDLEPLTTSKLLGVSPRQSVLNICEQFDRLGVPRIGSGPHPLTCEAIRAPRNPKAPHPPLSLTRLAVLGGNRHRAVAYPSSPASSARGRDLSGQQVNKRCTVSG